MEETQEVDERVPQSGRPDAVPRAAAIRAGRPLHDTAVVSVTHVARKRRRGGTLAVSVISAAQSQFQWEIPEPQPR